MKARLKVAERTLLYTNRACKGDASETGLVQFCQPIMDLDATRTKVPTYKYQTETGKEVECLIPFSSDIKFNAFIRDLNPAVRQATSADDNLCIFMKGAPERILVRCNKILINGKECEFT